MAKEDNAAKRFDFTNLNTLSVVSLASSVSGFGALAGVITGHFALAQIKESKQSGRGLAIAGLVVGYAGLALGVLGVIGRAFLMHRYGVGFGMMGGFGQDDRNGGMMGGWGQDDRGAQNGDRGGMMGGWTPNQLPTPSVTPNTTN